METVEFFNMCMIYDGSRVVVIDRQKKDWPGVTFPGGKVEFHESFTDSMIREVKEETGLDVDSLELCGIKDWVDDHTRHVVLLYKTNHFQGKLTSSSEGQVFWKELTCINELQLASGMEDMIRVFLEDELSEYFFYEDESEWKRF